MTGDVGLGADSNAVLIGVSDYQYAEFSPIRAARNSLHAMASTLSDPALCGWPPAQITVIPNPDSAADLANCVAELAENTTGVLLMYYVGHGVLSARGELCLTVTSTRPNRPKITGLPWETLADVLRTCPARMRLAILDCCFAGQAIEALGAVGDPGLADVTHVEGVYTLTATTRNRTAHVPPPGQQDTVCTSFTSELLDLIQSGIPAKPPQLTLIDIYPALRQRLKAKGLPLPNQRGTDTAYQFPFTANVAARTANASQPEDDGTRRADMTGAWSRSQFAWVVRQAELGAPGTYLSQGNGESRGIYRLQKYPNWICKEYWKAASADDVQRLNRLIRLPEHMTRTDKALVDTHTSWPAARVVDARQQTIGVLMPLAPAVFSTTRQLPSGRTRHGPLEIDVLALTEARQTQIKLSPQSLSDRISVCASFARVGALFERNGLVYLDWSYANVFWSMLNHSAYVIDLDGCSFGPRAQIESPNWADPLVPRGQDAGNESDRYRVALLTARCLTGMRAGLAEVRAALKSLQGSGDAIGQVAQLLIQTLNASNLAERSSIAKLSTALGAAKKASSSDLQRPSARNGRFEVGTANSPLKLSAQGDLRASESEPC